LNDDALVDYLVQNPRIATTLFSTTNPENVLKTIKYAGMALDTDLLKEVQKIFGPGYRDTRGQCKNQVELWTNNAIT